MALESLCSFAIIVNYFKLQTDVNIGNEYIANIWEILLIMSIFYLQI